MTLFTWKWCCRSVLYFHEAHHTSLLMVMLFYNKKNTIIYFQVTLISIKYSYCVFFQLHRSGSVLTDSYGVLSLQSPELLKLMLQRQIQLRSRFTGDWQRYLLMCSECFSANLSYMTSVLCLKLCLFFCLCEHHFCSSLYFWMWEMCCLMMNCKLYFSPP